MSETRPGRGCGLSGRDAALVFILACLLLRQSCGLAGFGLGLCLPGGCLGRDHYHTVGALHAINGRRAILDDVDLVDIFGVDGRDVVGLDAVHDEQRLGLTGVGTDSADDDAGHLAGTGLAHGDPRNLSADHLENVIVLCLGLRLAAEECCSQAGYDNAD